MSDVVALLGARPCRRCGVRIVLTPGRRGWYPQDVYLDSPTRTEFARGFHRCQATLNTASSVPPVLGGER
jgi:hypothetical protein